MSGGPKADRSTLLRWRNHAERRSGVLRISQAETSRLLIDQLHVDQQTLDVQRNQLDSAESAAAFDPSPLLNSQRTRGSASRAAADRDAFAGARPHRHTRPRTAGGGAEGTNRRVPSPSGEPSERRSWPQSSEPSEQAAAEAAAAGCGAAAQQPPFRPPTPPVSATVRRNAGGDRRCRRPRPSSACPTSGADQHQESDSTALA